MLDEVKGYLAITWDDIATNSNIQNSIAEGSQYLSNKLGTELNFDTDLEARALLKDYCRYVRNYSLEYFEANFLSKILGLQIKYATKEIESPVV